MDSEIKRDLKSNSVRSGQPTYEACDDVKHVMIILTHGYRFVCVEIFTAQSTQLGHVERGQFT